jgi:hypothetical protein
MFDGASEVLTEAGVKKIIVVTDVEACFGEEVWEVLFEILVDLEKTGSRVAGLGRCGLLHFFLLTSRGSGPPFLGVTGGTTPRNAREK